MPLKDLRGKTVYDLELEDFINLFCWQCKDCGICAKNPKTVNSCRQLIDTGVWDIVLRKQLGS